MIHDDRECPLPQKTGPKEVLTLAIAKMSRVFMVGASVHKEETMRFLQRAGVVHLEPVVPLAGDSEKQASAALLRLRHDRADRTGGQPLQPP